MKYYFITFFIIFAINQKIFSQTFNFQSKSFKVGEVYTAKNIYFAYNSDSLIHQSNKELDSLVYFLKNNPTLNIEVGVHSDTRGSDKYSKLLTSIRAKAIVKYLVKKGIKQDSLKYKGYESTQPLITKNKAISEADHQKNRRIEFKIIQIN